MNKNIRVPGAFRRDLSGDGQIPLFFPLAVSLICHIVFLVLVVFTPSMRFETPPAQSVINVSMVSLKTSASATPAAERLTPKVEKKQAVEQPPVKAPEKPVPKKAEIENKPTPPPKTSLKKKTFKSTEVVKHAIQQLEEKKKEPPAEQKEGATTPEMLKSALERLRQEVDKAETDKSAVPGKTPAGEGGNTGGKLGKFNEDGKRAAELIDLYRLEVAFQIQKQWAFNEQLAGGDKSLVAAIVFKVMPDGEIRDIFFTDRSGNTYLDESAYKAIVKSNPVDSHPKGLNQPYVEMGIRFTPQGIR